MYEQEFTAIGRIITTFTSDTRFMVSGGYAYHLAEARLFQSLFDRFFSHAEMRSARFEAGTVAVWLNSALDAWLTGAESHADVFPAGRYNQNQAGIKAAMMALLAANPEVIADGMKPILVSLARQLWRKVHSCLPGHLQAAYQDQVTAIAGDVRGWEADSSIKAIPPTLMVLDAERHNLGISDEVIGGGLATIPVAVRRAVLGLKVFLDGRCTEVQKAQLLSLLAGQGTCRAHLSFMLSGNKVRRLTALLRAVDAAVARWPLGLIAQESGLGAKLLSRLFYSADITNGRGEDTQAAMILASGSREFYHWGFRYALDLLFVLFFLADWILFAAADAEYQSGHRISAAGALRPLFCTALGIASLILLSGLSRGVLSVGDELQALYQSANGELALWDIMQVYSRYAARLFISGAYLGTAGLLVENEWSYMALTAGIGGLIGAQAAAWITVGQSFGLVRPQNSRWLALAQNGLSFLIDAGVAGLLFQLGSQSGVAAFVLIALAINFGVGMLTALSRPRLQQVHEFVIDEDGRAVEGGPEAPRHGSFVFADAAEVGRALAFPQQRDLDARLDDGSEDWFAALTGPVGDDSGVMFLGGQ